MATCFNLNNKKILSANTKESVVVVEDVGSSQGEFVTQVAGAGEREFSTKNRDVPIEKLERNEAKVFCDTKSKWSTSFSKKIMSKSQEIKMLKSRLLQNKSCFVLKFFFCFKKLNLFLRKTYLEWNSKLTPKKVHTQFNIHFIINPIKIEN